MAGGGGCVPAGPAGGGGCVMAVKASITGSSVARSWFKHSSKCSKRALPPRLTGGGCCCKPGGCCKPGCMATSPAVCPPRIGGGGVIVKSTSFPVQMYPGPQVAILCLCGSLRMWVSVACLPQSLQYQSPGSEGPWESFHWTHGW